FNLSGSYIEDSGKLKLEVEFKGEKLHETTLDLILDHNLTDLDTVQVKIPNIGVKGRVSDENGHPLKGLKVAAEGAGRKESSLKDSSALELLDRISPVALTDYHVLGESETDENGNYEVLYPPESYQNIVDDEPTIQVVVKD